MLGGAQVRGARRFPKPFLGHLRCDGEPTQVRSRTIGDIIGTWGNQVSARSEPGRTVGVLRRRADVDRIRNSYTRRLPAVQDTFRGLAGARPRYSLSVGKAGNLMTATKSANKTSAMPENQSSYQLVVANHPPVANT
jgi:hypothetical protein